MPLPGRWSLFCVWSLSCQNARLSEFEDASLEWADSGSARNRVMATETERIRIRMEGYDHRTLDASAREIVEHARRTNTRVSGPIPLPTRVERYTVLRSPHIDKKSREQFELRTHKRLIDIYDANARTVEVLNRLVVPAGVFVKIKA